jgi:hypothetical protein
MSGPGARRLGTYHSHALLPLSICAHVTPPFSKAALGTRRITRSGAAIARDLASFSASRRVLTLSRGSARSLGACCGRDGAVPSTRRCPHDAQERTQHCADRVTQTRPTIPTQRLRRVRERVYRFITVYVLARQIGAHGQGPSTTATPSLRACGVRDTEFGPLPQNLGRGQQLLSN